MISSAGPNERLVRQLLVDVVEQRCHSHTSVSAFAGAGNQAALFYAVEEPGDVRITGYHAVGNLPAGEPLRCSSQDA